MSDTGIRSSTSRQNLTHSEVLRRTDRRPVEQTVSDLLTELRGIHKSVEHIYFSGCPPEGDGSYRHISRDISNDAPLISAVRALMYAIPGRFIDGHICFRSGTLREAALSFCDILRDCSDPDKTQPIDRLEKNLNQLIGYFSRVGEAVQKGEDVDELEYSSEVISRINSIIQILCNDICESFVKRENEIRRAPGRSYRRPERANGRDGYTDKDRAVQRELVDNTNSILYITSGHMYGVDPESGSLCTMIRRKMAGEGLEIILKSPEGACSCQKAASQIIDRYEGIYGAYTKHEIGSLRKAISRRLIDHLRRTSDIAV